MAHFIEPAYRIMPGDQYHRLTVLEVVPRLVHCSCDCGETTTVRRTNWGRSTTSCGCVQRERASASAIRHGLTGTGAHKSWSDMKQRCLNPKDTAYANYGGRGIKVCERWMTFENFLADMGERPDGLTLDRIDVNGDYEPGNCRWADWSTQVANRRPKETCINGHALTEDNVRLDKRGKRNCRECGRQKCREWYWGNKAKDPAWRQKG